MEVWREEREYGWEGEGVGEEKQWQRSVEVKEEVERGDGKCKAVKVDEG